MDSSPSLRLTSGGSVTVPRLETGIAVMLQHCLAASRLSNLQLSHSMDKRARLSSGVANAVFLHQQPEKYL
jgi:hypothetical protein